MDLETKAMPRTGVAEAIVSIFEKHGRFTLAEAYGALPGIPESSIRSGLHDGVASGEFERLSRGVYAVACGNGKREPGSCMPKERSLRAMRNDTKVSESEKKRIDQAAYEYLKLVSGDPDMEYSQAAADLLASEAARLTRTNRFPGSERFTCRLKAPTARHDDKALNESGIWDNQRFGAFRDDARVPDGFSLYGIKTEIAHSGEVRIWARTPEEAADIADGLTIDDMAQHAYKHGTKKSMEII